MSHFLFDSLAEDLSRSRIDFGNDAIKVMLMGENYRPSQNDQSKRADILSFEAKGAGYEPGGKLVSSAISRDASGVNVKFAAVAWTSSTVSARGAVYYKSRGGDPSKDELIAYDDFADVKGSFNGTFSLGESVANLANRSVSV